MSRQRVVVVGAGIGGLAAALDLSSRGVEVVMVERALQPGGKMRQVSLGGRPMDAGPTVFTMRWVFDELLAQAGTRLDAHVVLKPADVLARHAWDDTSRLDLFADPERTCDAIGDFSGSADARGYRDFCTRARQIYATLESPFIRSARPTPLSLASRAGAHGPQGLMELARISPFTTLWKALGKYFKSERLCQLFGRYATYCGSSPYEAPATLMLVAHVERDGVWLVDGGMHRIAALLAKLVTDQGAQIRYGAHVEEIIVRAGRARGVLLDSGERIAADAVVFNGDVAALRRGLLGPDVVGALPVARRPMRSLSAITFNLLARTTGFPLLRHSVFFSPRYSAEFKDIFGRGQLAADPTVYVCAQDRGSDVDAPGEATSDTNEHAGAAGLERLLCIVNAPAIGDFKTFTRKEIATCKTQTFERLARCGLQVTCRPDHMQVTTPNQFEQLFPGTGGALYGGTSHGWAASFSRPGSRSRLPGLYLAGGSTHPGPGVPMAALSGRLAASSLLADRASMRL